MNTNKYVKTEHYFVVYLWIIYTVDDLNFPILLE